MPTRRPTIIDELRAANPVAAGDRLSVANRARLRSRISDAIAAIDQADTSALAGNAAPRARRDLRRRWVAMAITVIVVTIGVTPAFGLRPSFIPFFSAEKAAKSTQLDFASLSVGAPSGMNPEAIDGQTRKIMDGFFAGKQHTLWVAPTEKGGFCYEWTPGYGGCNATGDQPLDAFGELIAAPGVTVVPPPPGSRLTGSQAGRARATIPTWVAGFVRSGSAQAVTIRFKDGTTVRPEVIWVSSPINAGFFVYDVSQANQTADNHVVAVDAVDQDGSLVKEQMLSVDHG
jgi:hypothetical protein